MRQQLKTSCLDRVHCCTTATPAATVVVRCCSTASSLARHRAIVGGCVAFVLPAVCAVLAAVATKCYICCVLGHWVVSPAAFAVQLVCVHGERWGRKGGQAVFKLGCVLPECDVVRRMCAYECAVVGDLVCVTVDGSHDSKCTRWLLLHLSGWMSACCIPLATEVRVSPASCTTTPPTSSSCLTVFILV
jgi:hypothetical protein